MRAFAFASILLAVGSFPTATATATAAGMAAAGSPQIMTYSPDDEDVPNPERGLSWPDDQPGSTAPSNITLAHAYFRLDRFRARPIPQAVLRAIERRFAAARVAGVKIVPRFIYNFPAGLPLKPGDDDAQLSIVERHIDQLGPILARNSDIIAFIEAGFVGAWGEWHHSTRGLETVPAKSAILKKLLRALPSDRFVALRYARDKVAIFGRPTPATAREMLSGTDYGRVAHHNDCFLAAPDDWGTYRPGDAGSIARQKAWLAAENEHSPQGGETCNAGEEAQPFIHCAAAVPEMERQHWSQLNAAYNPDVFKIWKTEGCDREIAKRLGYRLALISATLPRSAVSGGRISGSLLMANGGFAAPYNRRDVELVLRNRMTGAKSALRLQLDPRRWTSGSQHRVSFSVAVPKAMPAGSYELLLNLPDPAPRLHARPQYAIRLANAGTWEAATGFNRLLMTIQIRR